MSKCHQTMTLLESTIPKSSVRFFSKKSLLHSFFLFFIPTSLLLSVIFYAFTYLSREHELQAALIRETAAVKSASDFTSMMLAQKLSDLLVLAEGETLREYINDGNNVNWARITREFSMFAHRKPQFVQIRYIDETGREQVRINSIANQQIIVPKTELQDKSHRYYFKHATNLSIGEIYISPMDLNIENGKVVKPYEPTIRFATPVIDDAGNRRGIVVLNYAADRLLARLSGLSAQMLGNTILLNPEGYWLMGAHESKLWAFMFDKNDNFSIDHPDAWAAMSNKDSGIYLAEDGLFIYRRTYLQNYSQQEMLVTHDLSLNNPTARLDDYYWILVSRISHKMIEELTSSWILISTATYLSLFTFAGIISFLFARNAVQKKFAYEKLQENAIKDDLTGTANRRELNNVGNREFRRSERFRHPLSIMMLDLDHFKLVNDTFGHNIGDSVLKHFTTVCQSTIRDQDFIARFGGEEFVILMPDTDADGAEQLAERICINLRNKPFQFNNNKIPLTVSIGISYFMEGDASYRYILARADKALYQAKINGRDQVVVIRTNDEFHSLPSESA